MQQLYIHKGAVVNKNVYTTNRLGKKGIIKNFIKLNDIGLRANVGFFVAAF